MDFLVEALVVVVKLVLAGFVMWGGWLCLSTWLRGEELAAGGVASTDDARTKSFERVASLVLLALLCTTIAALG